MIPKILTTTRVSELNGLTQQLIDKYTKGDYSSDSHLTQLFTNLTDTNKQLGIAIMRHTAQSELADMDAVTDNEVSMLHGLTKGYTCHPDATTANVATMLFNMIDKYGLEVKKKSYREEYPLLGSMLTESKTEPYPAYIAQLQGCAERFNRLETAVNNFNDKQNAFLAVKDDEKNLASATDIKKQLISFLNEELISYLNVMQKVQSDVYGELTQHIANRINESNSAVRLRRNKVEVNEQ